MYKVLIVDDKTLIRRGIISSINWDELKIKLVGEVDSVKNAVNKIEKERPNILITDIRMPDIDGLELLKIVSKLDSHIVSIVISGYDDFEYAKKAMKYGSIDYIMKPIDPVELNESLEKACLILDKNTVYSHVNEQLLQDYFRIRINGLPYENEKFNQLYEQYCFDKYVFCIATFKNRYSKYTRENLGIEDNNVNFCIIGDNDNVVTIVFFTDKKYTSIKGFGNLICNYARNLVKMFEEENAAAGIGIAVDDINYIHDSNKTSYEAILSSLLPGSGGAVDYSYISGRELYSIGMNQYERGLIVNISSGNINSSLQVIEELFQELMGVDNVSFESYRELYRNLCYILIKLDISFKNEINSFIDKISKTESVLKYESVYLLNQVIFNFYRMAAQEYIDEGGGKMSIISKVKSFIEKNYSEEISLNNLAKLFHINASYLTRIFKEKEEYNINEYIREIRVRNAKKILESGKVNIQKLAENVGYNDSTNFFKVFKKVTGMTPKEHQLKSKSKS